jgi:hypothetical protein
MCLYDANQSILKMTFHHDLPKLKGLTLEMKSEHTFGLLGHAMAEYMGFNGSGSYFGELDRFIRNVLDSVFSVPNANIEVENCISPLAVFLLLTSDLEDDDDGYDYNNKNPEQTEAMWNLFNKLVEKGSNLNAMSLQVSEPELNKKSKPELDEDEESESDHDEESESDIDEESESDLDKESESRMYKGSVPKLNEMIQSLQVPDALFISLLTHEEQYVKILIPHWWGPPVSLLLLCTHSDDIRFWMPILAQYDNMVPRGMAIHQLLHAHLMNFEHEFLYCEEDTEVWKKCNESLSKFIFIN